MVFQKGIHPLTEFKKGDKGHLGYRNTLESKKKMSDSHIGKHLSEEQKIKIGLKSLGRPSPMKGKTCSEETKKKISKASLGRTPWNKGKKMPREIVRKILRRHDKSSLENKCEQLLIKLNMPYKFVGDGQFFIENKCPDFINTNGEKIAVEVYYRKHKDMFRNGLENWKNKRKEIFNKYGWKIEFFDETQVNEEEIRRRL